MLSPAERQYLLGNSDISIKYAKMLRNRIRHKLDDAMNDLTLAVNSKKIRFAPYKERLELALRLIDDTKITVKFSESETVKKKQQEHDDKLIAELEKQQNNPEGE